MHPTIVNSVRILIADDQETVRRGVRSLLSLRKDWSICGEAADGVEAVEKARSLKPHIVLMDISMPRMDGLAATKILAREAPESRVIIISQNDRVIGSRQAAEVHASGYVDKADLARELVPTIDWLVGRSVEGWMNSQKITRPSAGNADPSGDAVGPAVLDDLPSLRQRADTATALLAAIVDSSEDAIVSKSLEGVITTWNRGAERLFGYTSEEAVGQKITLIIPHERWAEETAILDRLKRGERVEHFETVRMRKDGTMLDISLTISPVRDSTGRIIGASKIARDITERKRVELALRESEERFRTLADNLEAQVRIRTRELEQRNAEILQQAEQLRELARRLSQTQDDERRHIARELHDSAGQTLTLLAMCLARLVAESKQSAPQLAKDAEESEHLARQLTQEIRTTSYLLHPPLLDESGLSVALESYVRGLAERSGLDMQLSIPEDFPRLPRDMELVAFRLVQECLANVHRHSESKSAAIRIAREGENVLLEVEDHGKGISPERLAEIQSRRAGGGIRGMRERTLQYDGHMNIESNRAGTKISFVLPVPRASFA